MSKEIDRKFIVDLLKNFSGGNDISQIYYLIEQYICDVKNQNIKIGSYVNMRPDYLEALNIMYSFAMEHYIKKFNIMQVFDKNKKLIHIY